MKLALAAATMAAVLLLAFKKARRVVPLFLLMVVIGVVLPFAAFVHVDRRPTKNAARSGRLGAASRKRRHLSACCCAVRLGCSAMPAVGINSRFMPMPCDRGFASTRK